MLAEETQTYRQKVHTASGKMTLMTHAASGIPTKPKPLNDNRWNNIKCTQVILETPKFLFVEADMHRKRKLLEKFDKKLSVLLVDF